MAIGIRGVLARGATGANGRRAPDPLASFARRYDGVGLRAMRPPRRAPFSALFAYRVLRAFSAFGAFGASSALDACGGAPSTPSARPLAPTSTSIAPPTSCELASVARRRVPGLLAEGRLDRALRVIDRADARCPASVRDSTAERLEALASIGRDDEALALAARVESTSDATAASRDAAAKARGVVAARAPQPGDERGEDDADAALKLGELDRARDRLLAAWRVRRGACGPIVRAASLARRALAAKPAEVQRLADRAMVDCARAGGAEVTAAPRANGAQDPSAPATPAIAAMAAIAASADGARLALATQSLILALDLQGAPSVRALPGLAAATTIAISLDGGRVAAANGRALRLWDVKSGLAIASRELSSGARGATPTIAFVGPSLWLRDEGALFELDARTLAPLTTIDAKLGASTAFAFDAGGARVAVAEPTAVRLLDRKGNELARYADADATGTRALELAPDAARIALGGSLVDATSGKRLFDDPGARLRLAPQGASVARVASARDAVTLGDPLRPATSRTLSVAPARVTALSFRGDDHSLAIATSDGRVLLWSVSALWPSSVERAGVTLGVLPDRAAAFVTVPSGQVELLGDAGDALECRFGRLSAPFPICAERFVVAGLAARALAGERIDDEP
jgi:hypothetical protein